MRDARFVMPADVDKENLRFRSGWHLLLSVRAVPLVGQGEKETRSGALCRFGPDAAAVTLDDLSADRKPETRSGVFSSVQTFEHPENSVRVFLTEADTVVAHGDQPLSG